MAFFQREDGVLRDCWWLSLVSVASFVHDTRHERATQDVCCMPDSKASVQDRPYNIAGQRNCSDSSQKWTFASYSISSRADR